REIGATEPTASEYFRYVSIEATTIRASTVIRSMPTSETRTHASMTIPLSSTRSRTSMRLVPPGARSTAILCSCSETQTVSTSPTGSATRRGERFHTRLQLSDLCSKILVLRYAAPQLSWRQIAIVPPPVQSDLLCLVQRAHEKPDTNC